MEDTVTDERVGLFTPDKDGDTHASCGRVAVIWEDGTPPPHRDFKERSAETKSPKPIS